MERIISLNYNIYLEKLSKQAGGNRSTTLEPAKAEYLGVAQVNCFYASVLVVPSDTSSLKFIMLGVYINGITI